MWMLMKVDVGWGQACHFCQSNRGPINSDVKMDNYPTPINGDGQRSFQLDYVSDWYSAYNSPHHVQIVNNNCDPTYNNANGNELNCLAARQRDDYTEGIFSEIPSILIYDPTDVYSLSLDLKKLPCSDLSGSAYANVKLARGMIPFPENGDLYSPPPIVSHQLLDQVLLTDNNIYSVCENFSFSSPLNGFNQIYIHTENILPGLQASYINVENVLLSCKSNALTGFSAQVDGLEVAFGASWNTIHQDIISYLWSFGDGNSSTVSMPVYTYEEDGYYQVCLSIINENGCCAQNCREIMVGCPNPKADFNFQNNDCGIYTFFPDIIRPLTTYSWSAPNGIPSVGAGPSFTTTYLNNGTYTITLTATNECGSSSSTQTVMMNCEASCSDLSNTYIIQSGIQSRAVRLSNLLNSPVNPLPYTVLSNGTIKIQDKSFNLISDLIVDVKCEFERTNWFCAAGTLIDVQNDMTIKHSEFQSCDEMWKGFKHQYGKILRINDSSVKDAEFGVEASGNARFYSTRSVFQDCYTGVRFPGSGSTQSLINNFFKTKFIAETNLKNPYPGQAFHSSKMYYGIWIENIAELNVTECQFINLGYSGIQSKRSNIRCQSSKFKDDFTVNRGVYIEDSGPITHFQLDTFENNYLGIFNQGISIMSYLRVNNNNLFIKNSSASTVCNGIFIRRNYLLKTDIIGNIFEQNTEGNGIQSIVDNKLKIESNTFLNYSPNGFTGIRLAENTLYNSEIKANNLYSYLPLNAGVNSGFDLSACENLNVINNNFYNESGSNDLSDNISVEGVLLSVFRNNHFFNKSTAFKIQGVSNNNMFCCNTSTEPGNSIDVIDKAVGDYRNNNLHTLRLSIGGEIGQQPLPGNRWQDNNGLNAGTLGIMEQGSQMKAQSNQIATDPSQGITNKPDIIDPVEIEEFWFRNISPEIMSTCVSNPLCKDVGQYVGGGGNGGGSNNEEYNPWDPPIGDPPRRPLCDKVMENYFNYYTYSNSGHDKYPHQTRWNINDYLLDYINIYGQSFFDSCIQNSVIWITPDNEAWYDGEKDKQNIYIVSDPYKSLSDDVLNDADSISNEIYYLTDSVLYDTDTTVLQGLYDELAEITDDIKEISDDIHLLQKQRASDFLQNIPNLPEPHSFLTARKKVWTAEVKCFLYGESSVTPQEWAEIREIMLLCPYEAGKVVTEAKSLLLIQKEEVHEYNYNACQSSTPRTTNVKNSDEIFVYPNPGKNTIHVSIPDDEKIQFISIKNVHGSEVLRLDDVIVNNQSIDVSLMSPGLYFYEIKTNDTGKKYHGKLILVE